MGDSLGMRPGEARLHTLRGAAESGTLYFYRENAGKATFWYTACSVYISGSLLNQAFSLYPFWNGLLLPSCELQHRPLNVSSSRVYLTLGLLEILLRIGRVYDVRSIVSRDATVRSVLLSPCAPRRLQPAVPIGNEWRANAGDTAGQYASANRDGWPGDEHHACSGADELSPGGNGARSRHALSPGGTACEYYLYF